MKTISKPIARLFACIALGMVSAAYADNQTATLSPVLPQTGLPFRIVIEKENFEMPVGLHSGVIGIYKGQLVFIAGRTNGVHGFGLDTFPPDKQNTNIYVFNIKTGAVSSRALNDPSSGLNQQQIDDLSVTSPQSYQEDETLYMTGGYGFDNHLGDYTTKPLLTAFYLPGIIKWVTQPADKNNSVIKNMRQLSNSEFQVTGGKMVKMGNVIELVFGQNFTGAYTDGSNGTYIEQVRRFRLNENNGQLAVTILPSKPSVPDPNYRRRDLNVLPALFTRNNLLEYGLIAYAGVFTPSAGVWTVPVIIDKNGNTSMSDPNAGSTFKQAMNQYTCATVSLYNRKEMNMYHLFLGGISFGFFSGGSFQTDSEIPFINQITTVKMDKAGNFSQYLMNTEYPVILSTGSNPGNQLLFGAAAYFIPEKIKQYTNHIISLDAIRGPTVIGYVVGGIMSTVPNTVTKSDSTASPYVFKVTLIPN